MANLSFDIANSKDFYNKLIEDYNDYKSDPTSSRLAINCAMTAWHLGDWIYQEFKPSLQGSYSDEKVYMTYLKTTECLALEIMHRITNGSKHCSRAGTTHKVQGTEKHIGAFSSVFSREFDQTALIVKMDDGGEVWFEDKIDAVITFWQIYIPSTFGLTL
jgi:hypothetical protein